MTLNIIAQLLEKENVKCDWIATTAVGNPALPNKFLIIGDPERYSALVSVQKGKFYVMDYRHYWGPGSNLTPKLIRVPVSKPGSIKEVAELCLS